MMNVIQQSSKLPIPNIINLLGADQSHSASRHGSLLPNSVRSLIVGPSGAGKTNIAISLLIMPNGLKFENVYLYATTTSQPMYVFLRRVFENICSFQFFSEHDSVIRPSEALPNSVFIFDDVAMEKQDCIKAYFAAGRHNKIDVLYLSQTYTKIPKQLIRDNANMIIVFRQDEHNLKFIFKEHVGTDFNSFEDFKKLCSRVWNENSYSCLVIDKSRSIKDGKYRIGFDRFLIVE